MCLHHPSCFPRHLVVTILVNVQFYLYFWHYTHSRDQAALPLCDWLISLTIMISRFTHTATILRISLNLMTHVVYHLRTAYTFSIITFNGVSHNAITKFLRWLAHKNWAHLGSQFQYPLTDHVYDIFKWCPCTLSLSEYEYNEPNSLI